MGELLLKRHFILLCFYNIKPQCKVVFDHTFHSLGTLPEYARSNISSSPSLASGLGFG